LTLLLHAVVQTQVYIICSETLHDSPSCGPALDTLAQYYLSLGCIAAEKKAWRPAQMAADNALEVLEKLKVADPLRINYWKHRELEVHDLLQLVASQEV
jgi:hypothetical protein